MEAEWMTTAILIAIASPVFGHFEAGAPLWTRPGRWLIYLAVAFTLGHTIGRPWTWLWVVGLPLLGIAYHTAWCLRNGIDPLTAEPRDRYLRLRGWTRPPAS